MDKRHVELVKQQLQDLTEYLEAQLEVGETDSVEALSAYDNHPADLGTDTFERELDLGIVTGLRSRLDLVANALRRLDQGTYGICERCGQPIDPARLQAAPEVAFCLTCQNLIDQPYVPPPSEAEVVPRPLGRDIGYDVVEPDGEDFWQSVAEWGNSDTPSDTPPAVDYNETYIGFDQPIGYVEDVESIVDEAGEVLFDTLREKKRRRGESVDKETDQDSE